MFAFAPPNYDEPNFHFAFAPIDERRSKKRRICAPTVVPSIYFLRCERKRGCIPFPPTAPRSPPHTHPNWQNSDPAPHYSIKMLQLLYLTEFHGPDRGKTDGGAAATFLYGSFPKHVSDFNA